jgi:hypothetical protein
MPISDVWSSKARALTSPPTFAAAHGLVIRSLQTSVADDQALVAWTVACRDGSGNAQAAFESANRIGTQATALHPHLLTPYELEYGYSSPVEPESGPGLETVRPAQPPC